MAEALVRVTPRTAKPGTRRTQLGWSTGSPMDRCTAPKPTPTQCSSSWMSRAWNAPKAGSAMIASRNRQLRLAMCGDRCGLRLRPLRNRGVLRRPRAPSKGERDIS
jgi:hypothetical protein